MCPLTVSVVLYWYSVYAFWKMVVFLLLEMHGFSVFVVCSMLRRLCVKLRTFYPRTTAAAGPRGRVSSWIAQADQVLLCCLLHTR